MSNPAVEPNEPPPPYTAPTYPMPQPEHPPPPYAPSAADPNKDAPYREGDPHPTHAQNVTYGATPYDPKFPPGTAPPPPYIGGPPGEAYNMSTSTSLLVTREKKPPTFFLLSLLTCLCFSPLFGLVAIIFSALSDSAWHAGDHTSARRYSMVAITIALVGIITSVLAVILIFVTGLVRFQ